jgi:hypothetical protein
MKRKARDEGRARPQRGIEVRAVQSVEPGRGRPASCRRQSFGNVNGTYCE